MPIYNPPPRVTNHHLNQQAYAAALGASADRAVVPTPSARSLAMIQLQGEQMSSFIIPASPALLQHCLKQMHETGWLYLFNEAESIAIRADRVVAITFRNLTPEG